MIVTNNKLSLHNGHIGACDHNMIMSYILKLHDATSSQVLASTSALLMKECMRVRKSTSMTSSIHLINEF